MDQHRALALLDWTPPLASLFSNFGWGIIVEKELFILTQYIWWFSSDWNHEVKNLNVVAINIIIQSESPRRCVGANILLQVTTEFDAWPRYEES